MSFSFDTLVPVAMAAVVVVLVLGFIFVGLPALMPLFWAIYLLGH